MPGSQPSQAQCRNTREPCLSASCKLAFQLFKRSWPLSHLNAHKETIIKLRKSQATRHGYCSGSSIVNSLEAVLPYDIDSSSNTGVLVCDSVLPWVPLP